MSKESKCFDFPKQKKHYEKWKKLIKNLSSNKPNETESEPKNNEKEKKTFEDYFPVSTITKCYVNRLDYEPILRAWIMIPPTILLAIVIAAATIVKEYLDLKDDE